MNRFSHVALLLLLSCAPALAQSTSYSFDNFDTTNGVRIQPEPVKIPVAASKSRRRANGSATKNPDRIVLSTVLVSPLDNRPTSLHGYTTGSSEIDSYLVNSGTKNGVDPLLLYSIMHQESSFKLHAVSPKGARGLMQLMPGTAARYGVSNIFDPKQNIEGGARYVRFLLDLFDGDVDLALAGYNAGEGAVQKYGWRVPPYSETQEYVRRISRRYSLLRDPNAALYAPRISSAQLARLRDRQPEPLTMYERTVLTVRLPDGRLQLMSQ
jgi:hypothetical protein